jgi:hypothetical protein
MQADLAPLRSGALRRAVTKKAAVEERRVDSGPSRWVPAKNRRGKTVHARVPVQELREAPPVEKAGEERSWKRSLWKSAP